MPVKISAVDKIKFMAKGLPILKDLKKNPKKQAALIKLLNDNGYSDIAELAQLATKYLAEAEI